MGNSYDTHGLTGQTWFRPAVAAWFALLLGGGLWLMPPGVHEGLARGLALPRISSVFAAPLGGAGLGIICGAFALFGAGLGWAIADRVAEFSRPRPFAPGFEPRRTSRKEDPVEDEPEPVRRRRVFSASEDIGEDGIAAAEPGDGDHDPAPTVSYAFDDGAAPSPASEFDSVYAGLEDDYPAGDTGAGVVEEEDPAQTLRGNPGPHVEDVDPDGHAAFESAEYEPALDESDEINTSDEEPVEADWHEAAAYTPHDPFADEPDDYVAETVEDSHGDEIQEMGGREEGSPPPEDLTEGLDGMSLDALLGRLEEALETHGAMVADSERAANEPPPRPIPLAATRMRSPQRDPLDAGGPSPQDDDNDPVIAFLRREASRRMPGVQTLPADQPHDEDDEDYDEFDDDYDDGDDAYDPDGQQSASAPREQMDDGTHNALRSALERLGQGPRRG